MVSHYVSSSSILFSILDSKVSGDQRQGATLILGGQSLRWFPVAFFTNGVFVMTSAGLPARKFNAWMKDRSGPSNQLPKGEAKHLPGLLFNKCSASSAVMCETVVKM